MFKYTTGIDEKLGIKLLSASAIWAYLYNHQGIKASLNRPNIKSELELNKMEYERELNKIRYQEYHKEESIEKSEMNVIENLVFVLSNVLKILST